MSIGFFNNVCITYCLCNNRLLTRSLRKLCAFINDLKVFLSRKVIVQIRKSGVVAVNEVVSCYS